LPASFLGIEMKKWIYMLTNMPVQFADGREDLLRAGLGYELDAQEAQRFINFGLAVPMEEPKNGAIEKTRSSSRTAGDGSGSKRLPKSGRSKRGLKNSSNDRGRNAKA
jgi:hypothetical protein